MQNISNEKQNQMMLSLQITVCCSHYRELHQHHHHAQPTAAMADHQVAPLLPARPLRHRPDHSTTAAEDSCHGSGVDDYNYHHHHHNLLLHHINNYNNNQHQHDEGDHKHRRGQETE